MKPRLPLTTLVVALVVACWASPASAKVLPVSELHIATRAPRTGAPVRVVLRMDPTSGIDGPVRALTHGEVALVPARRTDQHGWPLAGVRGRTVVLEARGGGEYRGSFTVQRPGAYVVFSQSSAIARTLLTEHVSGIPTDLPAPIRIRVTR